MMFMKPILFFHPCNDYTGSTRVLSNIIAEEYSGQKVVVITERNMNKGFLSEHDNVKIINVCNPKFKGKPIPVISSLIWRFHSLLLALMFGWRYRVFYINTILPFYAALVGRLYCKPIVWHVHEKFVNKSFSIRIVEFFFNRTVAHRIFVSQYVKEQYPENHSCTYEIKYNKLPLSYMKKVRKRPLEERKRNKILMLSSLSLEKGVDMFVKLADFMPEYRFTLILSTDKKHITNFFSSYNVPENCEILSSQPDIHPFLYNADLILNLTNYTLCIETFGMTILEAMPYGIPAVVPNVGGPIELVRNGYNGYCVDVRDLSVLMHYIHISLDKENYNTLVKNTLSLYDEKFK